MFAYCPLPVAHVNLIEHRCGFLLSDILDPLKSRTPIDFPIRLNFRATIKSGQLCYDDRQYEQRSLIRLISCYFGMYIFCHMTSVFCFQNMPDIKCICCVTETFIHFLIEKLFHFGIYAFLFCCECSTG